MNVMYGKNALAKRLRSLDKADADSYFDRLYGILERKKEAMGFGMSEKEFVDPSDEAIFDVAERLYRKMFEERNLKR